MSSPASNFLSKSRAFIDLNLLIPRTSHRDEPCTALPRGNHRRPVLVADLPDDHPTRFVHGPSGYLDDVRIQPQFLSRDEVDTVLARVRGALPAIELELHRYT